MSETDATASATTGTNYAPATGTNYAPATGTNYAPAIYGSLLVTGLVAVQWRHDPSTDGIALTLVITVAIFWLAHAWSEVVNRRVHGPISRTQAVAIARAEGSMFAAAIVPALVLVVGSRVATVDQAIGAALAVSIAQLFVWGLIVGWVGHHRWPMALGVALIDSLFGLVIVAAKVAVLH